MINAIDKKQMYDNVIMGKENASKEWYCIIPMFLTSFNVYFVFGYAYFMCICFKTAIWLFLKPGLAYFGEDRLATLSGGCTFYGSGFYLLFSKVSKLLCSDLQVRV